MSSKNKSKSKEKDDIKVFSTVRVCKEAGNKITKEAFYAKRTEAQQVAFILEDWARQ